MKFSDSLVTLINIEAAEEIYIGKSKSKVFKVPGKNGGIFYLKTSESQYVAREILGSSLSNVASSIGPQECLRLGAGFLRTLHLINTINCPFNRDLKTTLSVAKNNLDNHLVDAADFDAEYLGKPPQILYVELMSTLQQEDLVFTHGDYCF